MECAHRKKRLRFCCHFFFIFTNFDERDAKKKFLKKQFLVIFERIKPDTTKSHLFFSVCGCFATTYEVNSDNVNSLKNVCKEGKSNLMTFNFQKMLHYCQQITCEQIWLIFRNIVLILYRSLHSEILFIDASGC